MIHDNGAELCRSQLDHRLQPVVKLTDEGRRGLTSLIHIDDQERVLRAMARSVVSGQPFDVSYRVLDRQGRTHSVQDRGQGILAAQDIGIDLASIRAYIHARKLDEMMQAIVDSAQRAARIVENMLTFSRKGEGRKQPGDLVQLLDLTLELAANDYDLKKHHDFRNIRIEREFSQPYPVVDCEAGKIQQVLLNLFKNAAQALMEVERPGFSPCLVLRVRTDGSDGVVEVEDNGPGMPEAVRRRIFEPLFTTKDVGLGTGLGLSVSYFIVVEEHMGSMAVNSTPDRGTRFTIRLPLAEAAKTDTSDQGKKSAMRIDNSDIRRSGAGVITPGKRMPSIPVEPLICHP